MSKERIIIESRFAEDGVPVVVLQGVEGKAVETAITCTTQKGAEHVARTIAEAIQQAGGEAQVRRRSKSGRYLKEWTYGSDPSRRKG